MNNAQKKTANLISAVTGKKWTFHKDINRGQATDVRLPDGEVIRIDDMGNIIKTSDPGIIEKARALKFIRDGDMVGLSRYLTEIPMRRSVKNSLIEIHCDYDEVYRDGKLVRLENITPSYKELDL